jgi:hypothetical protein
MNQNIALPVFDNQSCKTGSHFPVTENNLKYGQRFSVNHSLFSAFSLHFIVRYFKPCCCCVWQGILKVKPISEKFLVAFYCSACHLYFRRLEANATVGALL